MADVDADVKDEWKTELLAAKDETPVVGFRPLPRKYSEHYLRRNFPR